MAFIARSSPIRRPLCSLQQFRPAQHVRSFTSTRTNSASTSTVASTKDLLKNMPKQQAVGTRMKRMKRSEIPSDIGLLPMSYIRACGQMPSWFSSPMLRLQLEWWYLRQTASDFGQLVYYHRWGVDVDPLTQKKKKFPLQLRDRQLKARDLHKRLNTALATGSDEDISELREIACSGLVNQQVRRIQHGRLNDIPPQSWSVKYRGWTLSPRIPFIIQALIPSWFKAFHVVADREVNLPVSEGVTVRQTTFRVDSTQTLNRNDGSPPVTKTVREYFVLQKMMHSDGEIEEWKVWGTTLPSTTEDAMQYMHFAKSNSTSLTDRFRSMLPG